MASEQPEVKTNGRYSVNETCEHLQISRSTLYGIPQGLLPFSVCANGRRRYRGDRIIAYWRLATR